jgi:DNA-binding GntR family transcriptional regulator
VVGEPARTEAVLDRLRDDILAGRLAPGSRLRFADLGDRYGASMGVTREALSRLAEQGLVVSERNLGFQVISLSARDLVDLTETRCQLEGTALAMAVEYGGLDWESNLLAAHHILRRTPMRAADDRLSGDWVLAHSRFHTALVEGCPNERLKALASSQRDTAEVYRHWSSGAKRDTDAEHRELCDAALARDVARACALLVEHLVETARILLEAAPAVEAQCLTRLASISTVANATALFGTFSNRADGHPLATAPTKGEV